MDEETALLGGQRRGLVGMQRPDCGNGYDRFRLLMLLATQIDNRNEEEQKAAISVAVDSRNIDLKPLLPNMKNCDLTIGENGKAFYGWTMENCVSHVS